MACALREHHRTHLRFSAWTFWPVKDETDSAARAHQPGHLQHGADRAARAGSSYGAVAKSLNKTGDVFTVATLGREHDDLPITPPVGGHHYSFVPEDVDGESPAFSNRIVVFPSLNFKFCTRTEQPN